MDHNKALDKTLRVRIGVVQVEPKEVELKEGVGQQEIQLMD